ncbi:hypothetical protein JIN85_08260 [Luteolibacter pohnpeiensis]|uniref:Uncharacterized protein n=1 Tax=Luteolibacter pohnpeiensis TaxID=454153 RepID=A0A934S732_9BACT|nr:hypothetical protein [Luteolibacter pohnpeiensis]MBK1882404.1 hypothetical protein [Luteolibacter pohnpeiensis]
MSRFFPYFFASFFCYLTTAVLGSDFTQTGEVSLADALDAPASVKWITSPEHPFTALPDDGAVGGSSAQIGLTHGEESWLEAEVEGSGQFDFWLRDVPGAENTAMSLDWELWIDGVRSEIESWEMTWRAQWVLGDGIHRVRLVVRNSSDSTGLYQLGVDQVSWVSYEPADVEGCTSSLVGVPFVFTSGGRNEEPQAVLPIESGRTEWIEKTVTGPGELTWSSRINYGDYTMSRQELRIDGLCEMPLQIGENWEMFCVHVPAGVHTVRWISEPEVDAGETPRFRADSIWQISGLEFTEGITPLMLGIDDAQQVWLSVSETDGLLVEGDAAFDGTDAWSLGEEMWMYFCNVSYTSQLMQAMLLDGAEDEVEPAWREVWRWAEPGDVVLWTDSYSYGFGENMPPNLMDQFITTSVKAVDLNEALDCEEELLGGGWNGIASTDALDETDCGFSLVTPQDEDSVLSMTFDEAVELKFHWRHEGETLYQLRLNGAFLPLAPPTNSWQEVAVQIGGGTNRVEWVHAPNNSSDGGQAWLDRVEVVKIESPELNDIVTDDSGIELSSVTDDESATQHWSMVAARDAAGEMVSAARTVTGQSQLKAEISGPTVVHFRGRCFLPGADVISEPELGPKSVGAIDLGSGEILIGNELTVKVDGVPVCWVSDAGTTA